MTRWALALVAVPLAVACSDAAPGDRWSFDRPAKRRTPASRTPPAPTASRPSWARRSPQTFIGRMAGLDTAREPIDLARFHAMRAEGKKLLVYNVAAFWCSPCKEEAREFQSALVPKYAPRGVAFLTVVLQDSGLNAADDDDVDNWIRAFRLTFPVARDPESWSARIFDPSSMPLNMIVNLETMKVEEKIIGADLRRVTATLDKLLGWDMIKNLASLAFLSLVLASSACSGGGTTATAGGPNTGGAKGESATETDDDGSVTDFTLTDVEGKSVALSDYLGKKAISSISGRPGASRASPR